MGVGTIGTGVAAGVNRYSPAGSQQHEQKMRDEPFRVKDEKDKCPSLRPHPSSLIPASFFDSGDNNTLHELALRHEEDDTGIAIAINVAAINWPGCEP